MADEARARGSCLRRVYPFLGVVAVAEALGDGSAIGPVRGRGGSEAVPDPGGCRRPMPLPWRLGDDHACDDEHAANPPRALRGGAPDGRSGPRAVRRRPRRADTVL
jgi:hypothetical protein